MSAENLKFTNPEVAANYEATVAVDRKITIPLVYSGMLSNISKDVAEKLVAMQDNQLTPKQQPAVKTTPPAQGDKPAK